MYLYCPVHAPVVFRYIFRMGLLDDGSETEESTSESTAVERTEESTSESTAVEILSPTRREETPLPKSVRRQRGKKTKKKRHRQQTQETGSVPNVHWGAVDMSTVRGDPSFLPVRDRQDTPEWRAQHLGRVTGATIGALLGLYPDRLETALQRLDGIDREKPLDAKLQWGKIQEGVGILAAMRYVKKVNGRIGECGLCKAELPSLAMLAKEWGCPQFETAPMPPKKTDVLLGASPDGFIITKDNNVEVLEVKSVSPFLRRGPGKLKWKDRGPALSLDPAIVPQLQLEIYCAGPLVTSALVVSVAATKGASFFTVARDDPYIDAMLDHLTKRLAQYSQTRSDDVFTCDRDFREWTTQVAQRARGPIRVPPSGVPRPPGTETTPRFLSS